MNIVCNQCKKYNAIILCGYCRMSLCLQCRHKSKLSKSYVCSMCKNKELKVINDDDYCTCIIF